MLYNHHVCVLCMTRSGTQSHLFPMNCLLIAGGLLKASLLTWFCEKYSPCCICHCVVLWLWDFICLWYIDPPNRIVIDRFYVRRIDNGSTVLILNMGAFYFILFKKVCKSDLLRFCACCIFLYFQRNCLNRDVGQKDQRISLTWGRQDPGWAPCWPHETCYQGFLFKYQLQAYHAHLCILQVLKFWSNNSPCSINSKTDL